MALDPMELDVPPSPAIMVAGTSSSEPADISAAMARAFQTLGEGAHALGVQIAGPPRAMYHAYDSDNTRWTLAFPITFVPDADPHGDVTVGELAGGPAFRFTHTGPYEGLAATYGAIARWMIEQGHMTSEADWARYSPMWEEYVDDPDSTPPHQRRTFIYVPRRDA